jgi:hypothetical protein
MSAVLLVPELLTEDDVLPADFVSDVPVLLPDEPAALAKDANNDFKSAKIFDKSLS